MEREEEEIKTNSFFIEWSSKNAGAVTLTLSQQELLFLFSECHELLQLTFRNWQPIP